jgi:hypothetical protein
MCDCPDIEIYTRVNEEPTMALIGSPGFGGEIGRSRLQQSSSPAWLNLAEHGWAAITSDGQKMRVEMER